MLSKNKIKQLQTLRTKKGRQERGLFIAEGIKIVEELIKSDSKVREVYQLKAINSEHQKLNAAPALNLTSNTISQVYDLIEITEEELKKISSLQTPNAVLAVLEIPHRVLVPQDLKNKLTLVLEDIQDPGNMGTIIRIADWFGIENIICSMNSVDCYNSKVVQASMGSISRVKIYASDLPEFLTSFEAISREGEARHGREAEPFKIYGALLDGESVYNQKLHANGLIIIGNESQGISDSVQKCLTDRISIPSFSNIRKGRGEAESLNAAVAAGIICSEFRRSVGGAASAPAPRTNLQG